MSARLRIDLGALRANYALFARAAAPGRTGAVVKADGYGLGIAAVTHALHAAGCRDFFVATAVEALAVRAELSDVRIYAFEGALADSAAELGAADILPVLNHSAQVATWRRCGGGRPAAVHIDTGLHRLGFAADLTRAALRGLDVALLVTHLACADEPEHPMNALQLERLGAVRALFPGVPVSVGNSAGVLSGPAFTGDLGRPGIGLYGGNPFLAGPSPVAPVVTLEGRILQIRDVAPGDTVGYGATWRAPRASRIAVVGLGYGDGLPRLLSNRGEAALAGVRCPIVGRVSMDLTAIDVSGLPAELDDWVEFMGPNVLVDEVAAWAQTIAYEVLTGLGRRPQRELLAG